MNETSNIVKAILIYVICVPVAIFVGYQLTDPFTYSTFGWIGALLFVCAFPFMFRWHHLLLIASFNMAGVVFFIPGRPTLGMTMACLSLGLAVLQRTLNKHMLFIQVPQVTRPLIFLLAVILVTAELTGGIGLRSMGSSVYGGHKYVVLLCGFVAYFALTARRIPPEKVWFYMSLFFLGQMTGLIGDLFSLFSPSLYFIFWIFPPSGISLEDGANVGTVRIGGFGPVALAMLSYMLARYGIRGLMKLDEPKQIARLCLLVVVLMLGLLGGFRSLLITYLLILAAQFFLEGLHRTKLLPRVATMIAVATIGLVLFSSRMPYVFQRALTVVPLPLKLDEKAVRDAQDSKEWRLQIWRAVWPQVPNYLLLGKGLSISSLDFDQLSGSSAGAFEENSFTAVAGDYHNGPLSIVMPFGIWGMIGWIWFIIASGRVLYANYRYSLPEHKSLNTFLLAMFIERVILFFFVFGGFSQDLLQFAGLIGVSVSLNGGVCGSKQLARSEAAPKGAYINILRRPRPAYQP